MASVLEAGVAGQEAERQSFDNDLKIKTSPALNVLAIPLVAKPTRHQQTLESVVAFCLGQ